MVIYTIALLHTASVFFFVLPPTPLVDGASIDGLQHSVQLLCWQGAQLKWGVAVAAAYSRSDVGAELCTPTFSWKVESDLIWKGIHIQPLLC